MANLIVPIFSEPELKSGNAHMGILRKPEPYLACCVSKCSLPLLRLRLFYVKNCQFYSPFVLRAVLFVQ